jgi:hypothetical protein
MKTLAAISISIGLCATCTTYAVAGDQPAAESSVSAQVPVSPGDELHFVSVLTLNGEVVAIDPAGLLITLKSPQGRNSTLEVRSEKDLEAVKPGDRITARYVEGAQIGKAKSEAGTPTASLDEGINAIASGKGHPLVTSVESVDAINQEVTLKGHDGSLETIEVTNPEHLRRIKVGDHVVITHAESLALSLEKNT